MASQPHLLFAWLVGSVATSNPGGMKTTSLHFDVELSCNRIYDVTLTVQPNITFHRFFQKHKGNNWKFQISKKSIAITLRLVTFTLPPPSERPIENKKNYIQRSILTFIPFITSSRTATYNRWLKWASIKKGSPIKGYRNPYLDIP